MMKYFFISIFIGLFFVQFSFANQYKGTDSPGLIDGAYVIYKDSTTITLKTGFGECNSKFWQNTSEEDIDLSNTYVLSGGIPSADDFIYIYIDDSETNYGVLDINSSAGTDIIGSLTEPTWSNDKNGWYNGNDRCIGVVKSPESSSTISETITVCDGGRMVETFLDENDYTWLATEFSSSAGTWQTPDDEEGNNFTPVNAVALWAFLNASVTGTYGDVAITSKEAADIEVPWSTAPGIGESGQPSPFSRGWIPLGSSRKVRVYGNMIVDSSLNAVAGGYRYQR